LDNFHGEKLSSTVRLVSAAKQIPWLGSKFCRLRKTAWTVCWNVCDAGVTAVDDWDLHRVRWRRWTEGMSTALEDMSAALEDTC